MQRNNVQRHATTSNVTQPVLLRTEEAAKYLQVSPAAVRSLIKAEKLRATKLGKGWRVSRNELDRFVSSL